MPRHPAVHAARPIRWAAPIVLVVATVIGCGTNSGQDGQLAAPPPPTLPASTTAQVTTSLVEVEEASPTDPAPDTIESADPRPERGEESTTATDPGDVAGVPVTETSTTTTSDPSPTTSEAPSSTTSTTAPEKPRGRSSSSRSTTSGSSSATSPRTETRVIVVYSASPSRFGGANPFVTSAEEASFFSCVIYRESRGNAGAVNGSSGAAGLYQFLPSTWNSTARAAGRGDLVGLNPATVDINNQHYLAHFLYLWQGKSPWAADGCP